MRWSQRGLQRDSQQGRRKMHDVTKDKERNYFKENEVVNLLLRGQ